MHIYIRCICSIFVLKTKLNLYFIDNCCCMKEKAKDNDMEVTQVISNIEQSQISKPYFSHLTSNRPFGIEKLYQKSQSRNPPQIDYKDEEFAEEPSVDKIKNIVQEYNMKFNGLRASRQALSLSKTFISPFTCTRALIRKDKREEQLSKLNLDTSEKRIKYFKNELEK